MDDFGNLTIPGSFDPFSNPYGRSQIPCTFDEAWTLSISQDAYGGFGLEGFGFYDL